MKKSLLLSFCFFLFTAALLHGQTEVTLRINHQLGDETFAFGATATNNMGSTFNFSRAEYYLAEISLIHDGGQETMVEDLYVLVNAGEETVQSLGNVDVTTLEAIRFHVGVDEARNHEDPAGYAADHPLAPQQPSMHWGWAAGYRFAALEGLSGSSLNQTWEFHPLEDDNYFQTEVLIDLVAVDGSLEIALDADYQRAVEDINVDAGPIVHGGFGQAIQVLENFRDYVFTPSEIINSSREIIGVAAFRMFPNPAGPAGARLSATTLDDRPYELRLTDALGRVVYRLNGIGSGGIVELPYRTPGLYTVTLLSDKGVLHVEQLVIQ